MEALPVLMYAGAFAFGAVLGWVTYFIMRRAQPKALTDIATIVGALGGAAVINLFDPKGPLFGAYAVGLAVGFFGYYALFRKLVGQSALREAVVEDNRRSPLMGDERRD